MAAYVLPALRKSEVYHALSQLTPAEPAGMGSAAGTVRSTTLARTCVITLRQSVESYTEVIEVILEPCDVCKKRNCSASRNHYLLKNGSTLTICPTCLVWSMDDRAKLARQAHKEGRLIKEKEQRRYENS